MTRPARRGFFVSFEGGDGAGKSTHIRRLAEKLAADGRAVVVTREPGGSPGAEEIRKLLVEGAADRWSALAETLLMNAARADHLERTIRPALARGEIVLTDRFADSTTAYQGLAGALGEEATATLRGLVVGADEPDLTIILDLPIEAGLARSAARGGREARFESKGRDYQERVRAAFLEIARRAPDRCVVIDATRSVEAVFEDVARAVDLRLKARRG